MNQHTEKKNNIDKCQISFVFYLMKKFMKNMNFEIIFSIFTIFLHVRYVNIVNTWKPLFWK